MDKEARVAKLGNLSCKQFNSFGAIAENNSLRNVEFGEKSVKAVKLFFLFQIGIELSETFESQLIC